MITNKQISSGTLQLNKMLKDLNIVKKEKAYKMMKMKMPITMIYYNLTFQISSQKYSQKNNVNIINQY